MCGGVDWETSLAGSPFRMIYTVGRNEKVNMFNNEDSLCVGSMFIDEATL